MTRPGRAGALRGGGYSQGLSLCAANPWAVPQRLLHGGCGLPSIVCGPSTRSGGQGRRPQSGSALNIVWLGQVTSLTWLLSSVEKVTQYLPSSLLRE